MIPNSDLPLDVSLYFEMSDGKAFYKLPANVYGAKLIFKVQRTFKILEPFLKHLDSCKKSEKEECNCGLDSAKSLSKEYWR